MKQLYLGMGMKLVLAVFSSFLLMFILAGPVFASTIRVTPHAPSHAFMPLTLQTIVCGGAKSGSGWYTEPSGGYVGQGCGAGINVHNTPTGGKGGATSTYSLGTLAAYTDYDFEAWIPNGYATANMDFTLQICTSQGIDYQPVDVTINENNYSGWTHLFHFNAENGWDGCDTEVIAWSGTSAGYYLGLDAMETCITDTHCSNCTNRCTATP